MLSPKSNKGFVFLMGIVNHEPTIRPEKPINSSILNIPHPPTPAPKGGGEFLLGPRRFATWPQAPRL